MSIEQQSPSSSIPEWFHGEIVDLIELSKNLISQVHNNSGPRNNNTSYNQSLYNSIISTIEQLYICGNIDVGERNMLIKEFDRRSKGEGGVNYSFYFLENLYYKGYFNSDKKLFEEVRFLLLGFTSITDSTHLPRINHYYESVFSNNENRDERNQNDISNYSDTIIDIIKNDTILEEFTFINSFCEYIVSEGLVISVDIPRLTISNVRDVLHDIFYNLLLEDFYELNENVMMEVADLLITYYDIHDSSRIDYILDYTSVYTENPLDFI